MPKPPDRHGFTLLEVLVAIALTGLALVVLLQGTTRSLALTGQAAGRLASLHRAQALSEELRATATGPLAIAGVDADGRHWTAQLVPVAQDELAVDARAGERRRAVLARLAVAVRPTAQPGGEARLVTYTILLAEPADD